MNRVRTASVAGKGEGRGKGHVHTASGMCINKLIPPPLSRSLSIIPALPPQQASVHRAAAKFREAACVRVAKFTRAAFKYAMRSREGEGEVDNGGALSYHHRRRRYATETTTGQAPI